MLEGVLTRSNGISFCYRLCDHSSEDLSEDCGHNGTLEWHRGPIHLQTIPCCSPVVNRRGPNPHRGSTVGLQSRHFPGGPYAVSSSRLPTSRSPSTFISPTGRLTGQPRPLHIHHRLAGSRASLGRSAALRLRTPEGSGRSISSVHLIGCLEDGRARLQSEVMRVACARA